MPVVSHVSAAPPGLAGRAGWTPAALGPAVVGWWDAQTPATIAEISGAVSGWGGRVEPTLANPVAGERPTWSATGWDGSRPAVGFAANAALMANLAAGLGSGFTLCVVASPSGGVHRALMGAGSGTNGTTAALVYNGSRFLTAIFGGIERRLIIAAQRVVVIGSTSPCRHHTNGTEGTNVSTNLTETIDAGGRITLGGVDTVAGLRNGTLLVGEALAINRVLTAEERQRLEGYLAWRWGLQTSLPAAHPWKAAAPD